MAFFEIPETTHGQPSHSCQSSHSTTKCPLYPQLGSEVFHIENGLLQPIATVRRGQVVGLDLAVADLSLSPADPESQNYCPFRHRLSHLSMATCFIVRGKYFLVLIPQSSVYLQQKAIAPIAWLMFASAATLPSKTPTLMPTPSCLAIQSRLLDQISILSSFSRTSRRCAGRSSPKVRHYNQQHSSS